MDSREHSRRRSYSPRRYRRSPPRGSARGKDHRPSDRCEYASERRHDRAVPDMKPAVKRVPEQDPKPQLPPGFPSNYEWSRGDWLCFSPGCEGYVTPSKLRSCANCGRVQPHFMILTELAKNPTFRTRICGIPSCSARECPNAHAVCELRDFEKSRISRKPSSTTVAPRVPSETELETFISRWHIVEPGVSVLKRLPGALADVVTRSFYPSPQVEDTTAFLLKSLADLIRPLSVTVSTSKDLHDLLQTLLKRSSGPTGIACDERGLVAITMEREVAVISSREFSPENLGLLAFALAFHGMSVVHSASDLLHLRSAFPKLYVDLFARVRVVNSPSEIIYTAENPPDALVDRATQARIDALNPTALLPTPDTESPQPNREGEKESPRTEY